MRKGFTLIEMLVVVIIIGVLIAIGLPQYQKTMKRSKYGRMKSIARTLSEAQIRYFQKTGSYADSMDLLDVDIPRHKPLPSTSWWLHYPLWDVDGIWVGVINTPAKGGIWTSLPSKVLSEWNGYASIPHVLYGSGKVLCVESGTNGNGARPDRHCGGKLLIGNSYGAFYNEEK